MSLYLGENCISAGGSSAFKNNNIGEIIQSTIPLTDAGLHLLDGALINGTGSYADFVDYIGDLYNDDPTASYFCQQKEKNWVQPVATGSTTAIDGGNMVITDSSEHSGYSGWKAMDGIKSGTDSATGWGVNNTSATQWWQLKLPYQIRITGIKVYHRYDVTPANANTVGRFYTSSSMTTPIGNQLNDTSATNWQEFTISGIPSTGIVTDTLYFQKTGGGNYGGLGEVVIDATVVGDYITAEEVWQESVTNYGVCGKFVYDSTNNTVRLPKITGFTEGTTDVTALGDLIEAGLPNITGTFGATRAVGYDKGTGVFSADSTLVSSAAGSGTYGRVFTFDASNSNSIYGNSSSVQPQTIKVLYYIVVATSTKTDIQVDIDEIATDLNGKADVDLSNVNVSGTSRASGWSMPSSRYIDLTLGASGSTYTAPANGYFVLNKLTTNTNQYANFINQTNGMNTNLSYPTSGSNIRIYMPVLKGHIVSCSYSAGGTTQWFRFIYAEGESNV